MSEFKAVENMINDNEGMNNALEYYTNGDNEAYWKWFINKMEEEERQSYWGDWTDEGPYTNTNTNEVSNVDEVTNVDSDEEMEEEQDYWEYDDGCDYDDDYDDDDWDADWVVD